MIACAKCGVEMRCQKTGAMVHFGNGHIYAGDAFACERCGAHIVHTTAYPFYSERARHYVEMDTPDNDAEPGLVREEGE